MLKDARTIKDEIINEAKTQAGEEANKMINNAREAIQNEKMAALVTLKNEVGKLSLEIAENMGQPTPDIEISEEVKQFFKGKRKVEKKVEKV